MKNDVKKTETPETPAVTAKSPDGKAADHGTGKQAFRRNLFDVIADFFKAMTLGIFKFAIIKLPVSIWKFVMGTDWRKVLKCIYSMWRVIAWSSIWLILIFAGWIAFALEKFLNFWRIVGNWIIDHLRVFWMLISDNAAPIWFVIAIIGSVYGLLYVTWKRGILKTVVSKIASGFRRRKKTPAPEAGESADKAK